MHNVKEAYLSRGGLGLSLRLGLLSGFPSLHLGNDLGNHFNLPLCPGVSPEPVLGEPLSAFAGVVTTTTKDLDDTFLVRSMASDFVDHGTDLGDPDAEFTLGTGGPLDLGTGSDDVPSVLTGGNTSLGDILGLAAATFLLGLYLGHDQQN